MTNPININKAAFELGKRGGRAVAKKYGKKYLREIASRGGKAPRVTKFNKNN